MRPSSPEAPHILVFDSGLGGLSIVDELTRANIGSRIFYLADTAFFPYGEKSDASLLERIPELVARGVSYTGADLVIIACNTASTLALDAIRGRVSVPVIGVVPAIKPAAALTKTGTIGLLATPNTVTRPYTDQLIADFAQGITVVRHGAIGLAAAAEAMLSGTQLDQAVIEASIDGLFGQSGSEDIDVVVLACTHYPHVKDQLSASAPRSVKWIDSGAAIARRAGEVLGRPTIKDTMLKIGLTTGSHDSNTQISLTRWGFEAVARFLPK